MRFRCTTLLTLACALLAAPALPAQTPAPAARNRVIGAVASIDGANASFTVKTDAGEIVSVGVAADTKMLRTEPGAKTLQGAQAIEFGDIVIGDRVLAQGVFKEEEKRLLAVRVIDMSEGDIAKKRQAEAQDWQKRGVAGVVTAKDAAAGLVTLRLPALMGEGELVKVSVSPKAQVKRYAPDSIKYSDAKSSSLNEIAVGDQVRALGSKDEATGVVQAERVVSGSFATIAATVVSIDAAAHTLVVKNMDTGKPVTVKIIADSNLRRMPQMGGPGGMPGMGGGAPGAAAPGAQAGAAGAPRAGGFPGGGMNGGAPGGARRGGDFSRFIEFMPKIGLDALKAGETIVVASSKGGKADEITAITLLAGADFLVQMAQMRAQQAARANGAAAGPSMGMNLDVMSMIPGQ